MDIITATALRNMQIKLRCYPKDFFIGTLLTCFLTVIGGWLIYSCVYNGNISDSFVKYTGTEDYMSYVIIGGLFNTFFIRTLLNVSRSLITELREGSLESFLITPINFQKYLWGFMAESTITTTFETAVAFLICIPFGINFSINGPFIFLYSISFFICSFWNFSYFMRLNDLYKRYIYIAEYTFCWFIFFMWICFSCRLPSFTVNENCNIYSINPRYNIIKSKFNRWHHNR